MKNKPIINTIVLAFFPGFLLGSLHLLFVYSGFYVNSGLGWIDIPLHVVGGACVAFAGGVLLAEAIKRKLVPRLPPYLFVFCIVGAVAVVGVFWEFYEFFDDYFNPIYLRQPSIADTMKDMANDLNGGFVAALILSARFANILTRPKRGKK